MERARATVEDANERNNAPGRDPARRRPGGPGVAGHQLHDHREGGGHRSDRSDRRAGKAPAGAADRRRARRRGRSGYHRHEQPPSLIGGSRGGSMRVRAWRLVAGIGLAFVAAAAGGVALLHTEWASRRVAREAAALLEARFEGRVKVDSLSMTLYPRVSITGTNLRVTRDDAEEPMLEVARFAVAGTPVELFRRRASRVELDGL